MCTHPKEHRHCTGRCPWLICDRCGRARAVAGTTLHGTEPEPPKKENS